MNDPKNKKRSKKKKKKKIEWEEKRMFPSLSFLSCGLSVSEYLWKKTLIDKKAPTKILKNAFLHCAKNEVLH